MIKQLFAATVALGTFTFSGANAADLPLPAKAPPLPPARNWSGCYLGIVGGGVLGNDRVVATTGETVTAVTTTDPLVGGTFGCNYQFSPFFAIGIEDDISWSGLEGTAGDLAPFNTAISHSVRSTWLDTLRGRAGIVTWDNAFFYVTGGAAFTAIQDSVSGGGFGASATSNVTGWTVGGGVEFWPFQNLSLKVEYLFVQFPTIAEAFNTVPGNFIAVNTRLSENVIRGGINWHFDWWAPGAAKF
jgi:outer membrane immunogenic protein